MNPLRITMAAREVIASGTPLRSWGDELADAGVARDEISSVRPRGEPLVLRVTAAGGRRAERSSVAGDWLCDVDGTEPRKLPDPLWLCNEASREWTRDSTWLGAWEDCPSARWSLHAAAGVGVARESVVLAACACVRAALHLVPDGQRAPRLAVYAAEAWARGEASQERVAEALGALSACGRWSAHGVAQAAAYAAQAVDFCDVGFYAAAAAGAAAGAIRGDSMELMACLVRREIPTIVVLRAAASPR